MRQFPWTKLPVGWLNSPGKGGEFGKGTVPQISRKCPQDLELEDHLPRYIFEALHIQRHVCFVRMYLGIIYTLMYFDVICPDIPHHVGQSFLSNFFNIRILKPFFTDVSC